MPIDPALVRPDHALCVYAEPLANGRRVVVVGDASLGLGSLLAEAGARVVHVYDPDGDRARSHGESARGVAVRALPAEGFEVRDGAFDLAIVPDLACVDDPAALLSRLRRLVGSEGAVIAAARNPDVALGARSIAYEDLYEMVSMQFAQVRMVGEIPFTGVTLAELGELEEDAQVSVDTQLGPEDRTPHVFVAVASQVDLALDRYALVQLPSPLADADADADTDVATPEDMAIRAALAEQTLRAELLERRLEDEVGRRELGRREADGAYVRRVAELEAQIAELEAQCVALEARAGEQYLRGERLGQEVAALEEEVARQRQRALDVEEKASDYKRMHAHSGVELTALRGSYADLEERLAVALSELDAVRAASDVPRVDPEAIASLASRAEAAEGLVAELEADLASAGELHAEELAQLEASLRDRARTIKQLEGELGHRGRLVKELVAAVEEAHLHAAPPPDASFAKEPAVAEAPPRADAEADAAARTLRDKLDHLALELARREGEIESRGWRIAELEERLTMAESRSAEGEPRVAPLAADADLARRLAGAESELDALRQALTQEHEARGRAESGDALAKAHAELARQATLIEQLSRELDARDRRAADPETARP